MAGEATPDQSATTLKIDPLSPFFLSNSDIPGIEISLVLLTSNNYEYWSHSMRMSLKSRRKFGFCDGCVKKSTDTSMLEQWEVVNCTIVQWLRNTIDPTFLESVPYVEEAAALWNDLEERFAIVDGMSIHALKTELDNCKQMKGMSVTTYYGKLKILWDALAICEPPFTCKCGRCLCDISVQAVKRLDNKRLHQFFMGLDSTLYGNLRTQQFQLEPLPTINHGYHVALQVECLLGETSTPPDVPDIVTSAVPGVSRTPADWKAICEKEKLESHKLYYSHCTIHGHDLNSCFIKRNKFLDWWNSRPRTLAELHRSRGQDARAGTSGGQGSVDVGSFVRANALTTTPADSFVTYSIASSDRLSGMYAKLIIDTGASNHVTGDSSLFVDHTKISPRSVGLPNGQCVLATIMGTMCVNNKITLHRVLFVPSLTYNLISVSQLSVDNDYILQFPKDACLI
ncbi:uncharacterized protein LOC141634399 [Silene latifolia]|uniref:uncharacterized protein LOC141634399 n=1 Tax=Silene latifolia TaxID=37657 RepID=UPI003D76A543